MARFAANSDSDNDTISVIVIIARNLLAVFLARGRAMRAPTGGVSADLREAREASGARLRLLPIAKYGLIMLNTPLSNVKFRGIILYCISWIIIA
jgi:hypothetical protein